MLKADNDKFEMDTSLIIVMSGVKKTACQNCGRILEVPIDDVRKKHYCNKECRMKSLKSNFKENREIKRTPKTRSPTRPRSTTNTPKSKCSSCQKKKKKI